MNKKIILYVVLGAIVLFGGISGIRYFQFMHTHETTDDAQIDGNIIPVLAKVGAYVKHVHITDNMPVKAGTVLVELDASELETKLAQSEAALQSAIASLQVVQTQVTDAEHNRNVARISLETPKTNAWKAKRDYERYTTLYEQKMCSAQKFDEMKAAYENAESQLDIARQRVESAELQVRTIKNQVLVAQAGIAQKKQDVNWAQLQVSYTKIVAPMDGTISKKSIQIGQLVSPGQPLLSVVQDSDIWITANFKETQLQGIRNGNNVQIDVDAYPHLQTNGIVESIGAATGARFSLLPPDNASGNFVKVVQRIPVRIKVIQTAENSNLLKPGMSVKVSIEKAQ